MGHYWENLIYFPLTRTPPPSPRLPSNFTILLLFFLVLFTFLFLDFFGGLGGLGGGGLDVRTLEKKRRGNAIINETHAARIQYEIYCISK